MTRRRGRPRTRLPRYVQRAGRGFRGWWYRDGVRLFGPVRDTPEQAHDDAVEARTDLSKRAAAPALVATVGDGFDLLRATYPELRPGTVEFYDSQIAALESFFEPSMPLHLLSEFGVTEFVKRRLRKVSPQTVRHNLVALGRVFRLAMRAGLVTRNPVELVERPRTAWRKIPDRLTLEEIRAALRKIEAAKGTRQPDAVPPKYDADVVRFFFATGVRLSEAAEITLRDVRDGRLCIRHGKRRPRELPVPKRLETILKRLSGFSDGQHLFPGPNLVSRRGMLKRRLAKWQRRLEIPELRPHALRHSCGSHLGRWGFGEQVIGAVLGHAVGRTSITFHYVAAHGPQVEDAMRALWKLPPKSHRSVSGLK